ncbi:hypothetical protein UK82_07370 [Frankia sp. ACN1ag]|nr:hypothetical protein UK82_07370 [Frankia sp. ACN1ag]
MPVCDRGLVWTVGPIGCRLGVSRERARQLSHRPDFPPPVGSLSGGRAWAVDDVEAWIAEHRPTLTDGPWSNYDGPDIAVKNDITAAG